MDRVFIIIVTYNAEKWLDKCLSSFINMPEEWQLTVIDNGSEDNTIQIIEKKYSFVRLIENKKNMGFGQANNIGLQIALQEQAEYILLLNQDAYIDQKNILELIHAHKENPDYYILCPLQYNGDKTDLDGAFKNYIKNLNNYFYDLILNKVEEIYSVSFCNAACWLMPVECIKKIGGFSPVFFHYGEDDNYCQRVIHYGKKIGIVPQSLFCHDREFREPNTAFWNDFSRYYRRLLLKVSNPQKIGKKFFFERTFLKLILNIVKYLLVFNFKKAKCYVNVLKLYYKNYSFIKENAFSALNDKAYLK